MPKRGQPSDDVWSAPESGTVRDAPEESGAADGVTGRNTGDPTRRAGEPPRKDEPSAAGEEG